MKYFHYQLTENSEWIKEPGWSLAHIMPWINDTQQVIPYAWFTTPY